MRYRARRGIDRKRHREHRRALALIITIACIPILGAVLVIFLTTEQDLSDLIPTSRQAGEYTVLRWSDLVLMPRNEFSPASAILRGNGVRALGYMADGDESIRTGDLVQDFFLLPDVGNLFEPADRFPDQMI